VSPVLATITHLFHRETAVDSTEAEWQRLLAAATTPQERDEINDIFSRSLAA
jgi:hypothetical protein